MRYKQFDGLVIRHGGSWPPLVPQSIGVTDAVRAVERATLDVVE
jgi:hypothetical protein